MGDVSDREQYETTDNLEARIALHIRFSSNGLDWYQWVFDRLMQTDATDILEVGSGTGRLWVHSLAQVPAHWNVTVTDTSAAMVEKLQQELSADRASRFRSTQADICSLPFEDDTFDLVVANHMLYHAADTEKAIAELARVLRSTGKLVVATNGERHLAALENLMRAHNPRWTEDLLQPFMFADGFRALADVFSEISYSRFSDRLRITDKDAVVAYAMSQPEHAHEDFELARFESDVDRLMQAGDGEWLIDTEAGVFVCSGPIS